MKHLSEYEANIKFPGRIGFCVCAPAVFAADQLGKMRVLSAMAPNASIPVIPGFFHITLILNTGASFGMFQDKAVFFMILTGLLSLAIAWAALFRRGLKGAVRIVLGIVLGGALGNLTDRILRGGAVVDFIDFRGIWPYIFNIADMAVVCGGILLALLVLTEENKAAALKPKH